MTPKPRKPGNLDLAGTRIVARPRGNDTYYYWVDPRTGKERPLKAKNDKALAIKRAAQLNAYVDKLAGDAVVASLMGGGKTFAQWAEAYMALLERRHKRRELAANTLRTRKSAVGKLVAKIGDKKPLISVTVSDIAGLLKEYREADKERMAQVIRSAAIDMFKQAKADGWLPPEHSNVAEVTRAETVRVKRARLTLEDFKAFLAQAEQDAPWVANAMLLGLVTGQRVEDVSIMQFRKGADWEAAWLAWRERRPHKIHPYPYVEGGFLHVISQKTRMPVMIPLTLRLEAIGMSVGDVVSRCRDSVASRFLVHHTKRRTMSKPGDPVHVNTISKSFTRAQRRTGLSWPGYTPPTFHELRSLCERLYKEQGIDTQALLGHKQARTTALYHDSRGFEWVQVKA